MAYKSKKIVMCLALLGAGSYAAWLRVRPYLEHEGRYTDGAAVYDTSGEAVRYVVWDAPEPLAGAVNTAAAERAGTSSPDGCLFVFAVGSPGLDMDLYAADIVDGRTAEPRRIDSLCSAGDECSPAFDGETLYFASNRPGGAGGFDIYRAQRVGDDFAQPERLLAPVNGPHDDVDPAPLAIRGEIVFASDRVGGDFDLYTASLFAASSGVRALDELNTPALEREPTLTPDGRALVWSSEREGGRGLADLYQSFARADAWTPPEALTALCTESDERSPHLAADGFTLYFARSDADAPPDLFRARTIELYRIPSRPIGWIEILTIAALLVLALLAYLAQRWPSMDTIYKCFLISVLVHLALLWWTSRVLLESGGTPADRPGDRIRIRVERGESPALTERAGRLPSERSVAALDDMAGPTRVALAARDSDEAPPESIALQAADADGDAAPARAGAAFDSAESPIANTRLADSEDAGPTRGGRAQELALETPTRAPTRNASGDSGPTRAAIAHASGAALGEPAPGEIAIARGELDLGATTSARERNAAEVGRGGSVAQSTPLADVRDSSGGAQLRSGGATELALGAPTSAPTRNASGDAGPTRGAIAHASGAALGEPAPGEIAIARGELDLGATTSARERTAAEVGRGGSVAQSTPLADVRDSSGGAQLRSGGATELALGAPTSASTRAASGDAGPTRGAIAHASGAALGEPAPGEIAIARGELDLGATTDARSRTATDAGRAASAHSAVPLAEPSAAAGESRRRVTAPARDLLADLAPQHTPASAPVSASSNPERWQARDSTDPTPRPPSAPLVVAPAPMVAESPQPSTRQRWDHTPYQNRSGEEKLRALEMHGGSRETEQAVERGLAYLARIQRSRGHWGDMSDVDEKYGELAIGKTGLCMLAFLGAGHTHRSSTPYSPVVAKALRALLEAQDDASGHFGDSEAYGHAIATFALTECLALSGDDALRAPLERAVAHILAQQSKRKDPRFLGGWGYYYPDDRTFDRWPRTSITVWQVMALESARLSGIEVPDAAFADARAFLQHAHDESQGFVRYNHDPERLNSGYPTLPASTPAALFALSLLGADVKSAQLADLRSFTLERAPSGYRYAGDDAFVHRAQGNLYFWYYGTLAAFRIGGASWQTWNEAMKRTLLPSQSPDGSWKPIDIYAKYARDTSEDRAYTTAMCVLSLEIYYRYFLPLLKVR